VNGQVFTVKSHEVPEYRRHFEPALAAIERRTKLVTAADVLDQSGAGQAQLWGYAENGQVTFAAATRVHEMAQGKLCTIWVGAGAGTPEVFRAVHDAIESWALSIGCFALEIVGREGWQRLIPGYTREAVVLVKPLARMN
jgi:hypothetical protein